MVNDHKEEQLGMKLGKAQHRLRVMVMFHLVKRCGLDQCFRCNQKIESVGEFSIEHVEGWLHVDVRLFWDMDNIAFSHKSCNYRAIKRHSKRPWISEKNAAKIPQGKAWCVGHKDYVDEKLFTKNAHKWNGLSDSCKDCRSKLRSPRAKRRRRG